MKKKKNSKWFTYDDMTFPVRRDKNGKVIGLHVPPNQERRGNNENK